MFRTLPLAAAVWLLIAGCQDDNPVRVEPPSVNEFVFPLTPGTQWQYAYYYQYRARATGTENEVHGGQTWQVSSRTGTTPPYSALISVSRVDTAHDSVTVAHIDTTYITRAATSFQVMVTSDSVIVHWAGLMLENASDPLPEAFPRYTNDRVDTVAISGRYGWAQARFLNGAGLLNYSGSTGSGTGNEISSSTEELTMIGFTAK